MSISIASAFELEGDSECSTVDLSCTLFTCEQVVSACEALSVSGVPATSLRSSIVAAEGASSCVCQLLGVWLVERASFRVCRFCRCCYFCSWSCGTFGSSAGTSSVVSAGLSATDCQNATDPLHSQCISALCAAVPCSAFYLS